MYKYKNNLLNSDLSTLKNNLLRLLSEIVDGSK